MSAANFFPDISAAPNNHGGSPSKPELDDIFYNWLSSPRIQPVALQLVEDTQMHEEGLSNDLHKQKSRNDHDYTACSFSEPPQTEDNSILIHSTDTTQTNSGIADSTTHENSDITSPCSQDIAWEGYLDPFALSNISLLSSLISQTRLDQTSCSHASQLQRNSFSTIDNTALEIWSYVGSASSDDPISHQFSSNDCSTSHQFSSNDCSTSHQFSSNDCSTSHQFSSNDCSTSHQFSSNDCSTSHQFSSNDCSTSHQFSSNDCSTSHHSPSNGSVTKCYDHSSANHSPPLQPKHRHSSFQLADQCFNNPDDFLEISQFYFPNGHPLSPVAHNMKLTQISEAFAGYPDGLSVDEFREVVTDIVGVPSYLTYAFLRRLMAITDPGFTINGRSDLSEIRITETQFSDFFVSHLERYHCTTKLVFLLLQKSDFDTDLLREDFAPILWEVIGRHPGLVLFKATPEFQEVYLETVIGRIFYTVNLKRNNRITLQELRNSNFIDVLLRLEEEEDINEIRDYFSYEHFYTVYVTFYDLDKDHNFNLTTDELSVFRAECLTDRAVKRIMECIGSNSNCHPDHYSMSYADFLVFFISEEDKKTRQALDYWFRVIDLDGDGLITDYELEYFIEAQQSRVMNISGECLRTDDVLNQITDMIRPATPGYITRRDLWESKMSDVFFNILLNTFKFMRYERPLQNISFRADNEWSEWDWFVFAEYQRLVSEDEGQQEEIQGAESNEIDFQEQEFS